MIAGIAFIVFGLCAIVLTLGDCSSEVPNCHAESNRLLGQIIWSLAIIGVVAAVGLAWWTNRSPKDD